MKRSIILAVMVLLLLCGLAIANQKCSGVSRCMVELQIEWREYKFLWNEPGNYSCYKAKITKYQHKLLNEAGYYVGPRP